MLMGRITAREVPWTVCCSSRSSRVNAGTRIIPPPIPNSPPNSPAAAPTRRESPSEFRNHCPLFWQDNSTAPLSSQTKRLFIHRCLREGEVAKQAFDKCIIYCMMIRLRKTREVHRRDAMEKEILRRYKTVAVVGISADPQRASNQVSSYLKERGYQIIPVNPREKEVLGERCYPDLTSIPAPVEVVDIFRRSEDVPPIVEEAIKIGAKAVWMQEGIVNEQAAKRAREAGLKVVMDKCMLKEHKKLENI